jgi:hypothetical protein
LLSNLYTSGKIASKILVENKQLDAAASEAVGKPRSVSEGVT